MSLNIAEQCMYSKLYEEMVNTTGYLNTLLMSTNNNYQNIYNALYYFDSTTNDYMDRDNYTIYHPIKFTDTTGIDSLILQLRQNASDYIPILRRNSSDESSFLNLFKQAYTDTTEIQLINNIYNNLGIDSTTNINDLRVLPTSFVNSIKQHLLSACLEKIDEDYGIYDEFSIAINIAIINNNFKFLEIYDKFQKITQLLLFLISNYTSAISDIMEFYETLGESIEKSMLIATGIDTTLILSELSIEQQTNIMKVLKTIQLIINSVLNEIKLATGKDNIILNDIYSERERLYEDSVPT